MITEQFLQSGSNAWIYLPGAILLGVLHGLEPGHSKTMMAAFIVAIRGTIMQAVLLGICTTLSHTLIIWALAAIALRYGSHWNVETTEPYFQVASGLIIIGIAIWMFLRTQRNIKLEKEHHEAHHHHDHHQDHDASNERDFQDDHEKAHELEFRKRFSNRPITSWQIALFGLSGGLIPCPAALTVLLVCLQTKQFVLGFSLVACFSIGLALTLVTTGAIAAWTFHHASNKFTRFSVFARKAPYLSSAILVALGLYIAILGLAHF